MIELIARIRTGTTTVDDAATVERMLGALLDALAFCAALERDQRGRQIGEKASELWSIITESIDSSF